MLNFRPVKTDLLVQWKREASVPSDEDLRAACVKALFKDKPYILEQRDIQPRKILKIWFVFLEPEQTVEHHNFKWAIKDDRQAELSENTRKEIRWTRHTLTYRYVLIWKPKAVGHKDYPGEIVDFRARSPSQTNNGDKLDGEHSVSRIRLRELDAT